jgi:hypothetical protein
MASQNSETLNVKSESNSMLDSKFPIYEKEIDMLHASDEEFKAIVTTLSFSKNGAATSRKRKSAVVGPGEEKPSSRFVDGLRESNFSIRTRESLAMDNKTLTENGDVAFLESGSALVDLFYKFDNTSEPAALKELLANAWDIDPRKTLKLIFQVRSIHIGKGEKFAFYNAMAWLYEMHPQTFVMNLPWLVRPIVEKKKSVKAQEAQKAKEKAKEQDDLGVIVIDEDEDFEMINPPSTYASHEFDLPNGHSHSYWKDLLNMLVLATRPRKFKVGGDFAAVFSITKLANRERVWDENEAKKKRGETEAGRVRNFEKQMDYGKYKVFYAAVARIFANQLSSDLALLEQGKNREISLAAKWAPTPKEFHDKHSFIVQGIAEVMFPQATLCPDEDRVAYLKMARMNYRFKVLSPLRKALNVVERHITAGTFSEINYESIPSLAMERYRNLFRKKDSLRFREYLVKVKSGEANISGAILMPAQLVQRASSLMGNNYRQKRYVIDENETKQEDEDDEKTIVNAQWKSIVERVRRSGKLSSSIAVCDVSGSMMSPPRKDGTTPIDSAIGLSLLLSEVTEAPFGGNIITFQTTPSFFAVGGPKDKRDFVEQVQHIRGTPWGTSTDFVAVFEKLILPMAKKQKLKQEEMVKQVFVFSDMQFNQADGCHNRKSSKRERWSTSFERIQKAYKDAGYEMPTLIFWNLAGREAGVPVKANEPGTALISGYSQAQMKIFIDEGAFDDEPIDSNATLMGGVKAKARMDGQQVMSKAISHKGFAMLQVYD